mmetsp:Transcript_4620/g.8502  ORF Transcript_4620/g.8502 Transcript_4620/m.8502 type:complete len:449 (+) Transcript_4620:3-1349(+)
MMGDEITAVIHKSVFIIIHPSSTYHPRIIPLVSLQNRFFNMDVFEQQPEMAAFVPPSFISTSISTSTSIFTFTSNTHTCRISSTTTTKRLKRNTSNGPALQISPPSNNNNGNNNNNNNKRRDDDDNNDDDGPKFPSWTYFLPILLPIVAPSPSNASPSKLRVVATTTIIHDLAKHIGGDLIDLHGLIKPGDDPHIYEPVPQDSIQIEKSDVVLYNGYDLESNLMPLILSTTSKTRRYAVGEAVVALPSSDNGIDTPDPHVWNDARNAISMAKAVCIALVDCDREHAKVFEQRCNKLAQELTELDSWIRKCIKSIPAKQRLLVTTHDAFQYYAKAYGLIIPGTLLGINTEEQPSARMMFELIEEIRRVNPPAVFFEQTVSPVLIKAVAEDAQVKLCEESLYSDSIGPQGSGAETYAKMMAYNTRVIVSALGGKIAPPPLAIAWANPNSR